MKRLASLMLMLLISGFASSATHAQDRVLNVDPEAARQCIKRAANFIFSQMSDDHWRERESHQGGVTALCTLALLNAGESPDDPRLAKALRYLERTPSDRQRTTYSVSLRVMTFCLADPFQKRFGQIIREDVDWLAGNQSANGGWAYPSGATDPSNTQFALLALHEAAQIGVTVPVDVWERADKYWNLNRMRGGAYAYSSHGVGTGSMTTAAISSLIIVRDNLVEASDFIVNGKVDCCRRMAPDSRLEGAINWVANRFTVTSNISTPSNKYYYLYGLERAGRVAGLRFFGDHDWYRQGAAHLITQQNRQTGAFSEFGHGMNPGVDLESTAFALLFMAKGLRPILFGKYQYTDSDEWNLHSDGIHYLSRETEKAWGFPLNWQTIRSQDATVNDLLEAPVLFFSGRSGFSLSEEKKQALKSYIENGGFIFAEACGGEGCGDASGFDQSFRSLMQDLFPDSPLEPLAAEHPIWTADSLLKPNSSRPLLGLQNCCRTSIVYCPANLSCYWQLDRPAFLKQFSNSIREEIVWCRQAGINIAAYATNRELKVKLESPKVNENLKSVLAEQSLIFPKLIHNGGSDEAPAAWGAAQREFRTRSGFDIVLDKRQIPIAFEQMANYPVLFMHGRRQLTLDDQQREALKNYVEGGNLVLIDAICASPEFADSVRREIEKIFPKRLEPIAQDDEIWSDKFGGYPLRTVTLRTPDRDKAGGAREEKTAPKMLGIKVEGRWGLIFSPFDLSCALEHAAANQCAGYSNEDAQRIVANVLIYALAVD